jgi:hypothetical protein
VRLQLLPLLFCLVVALARECPDLARDIARDRSDLVEARVQLLDDLLRGLLVA